MDCSFDVKKATDTMNLRDAMHAMRLIVTKILNDAPLMSVHDVVAGNLPTLHTASLTESQWRLIRFAIWHAEQTAS